MAEPVYISTVQAFNPLASAHGRGKPDTRLEIIQQISDLEGEEFTHRDIDVDLSKQQLMNVLKQACDEGSLELVYKDRYDKPGSLNWYRLTDDGREAILDGFAAFYWSLITAVRQNGAIPEHYARDIVGDVFVEMFNETMVDRVRKRGAKCTQDWKRANRLMQELRQ